MLSIETRKDIARRLLAEHPTWSSRRIALEAQLAPRTVEKMRDRAVDQSRRESANGRMRPLDPTIGRRRALNLLTEDPEISLREAARRLGISPNTVGEVRKRLRRGEDATAPQLVTDHPGAGADAAKMNPADIAEFRDLVRLLRGDPILRHTDAGRLLISLLARTVAVGEHRADVANALPDYFLDFGARAVRLAARELMAVAAEIDERARRMADSRYRSPAAGQ
ncbi:winged helix-turn-helix domain-containing protein [Pseudonocardia sp. TRM90224]|uniref:winged helix-turn-helix domain-containing protein n=1 Tax=Pseudonocardia sp. TRM90224 TaxID=2812678 RepID=UPI001E3DEBDC|nr:winged helix-turn-helix domain-containing protein [Pseudonocardia sp. TRM90224]